MIIDEICSYKKKQIDTIKQKIDYNKILTQINPDKRSLIQSIKESVGKSKNAIIGEIKFGSPLTGTIISFENDISRSQKVQKIAQDFEKSSFSAISVITDDKYFNGSTSSILDAKKTTNLPILRKDFIIDQAQVYESKMIGADAILLIASLLTEKQLIDLENIAISIGLEVLCEIHTEEDLRKTLYLKTQLIGVNSRNLKNMQIDFNHALHTARLIPKNKITILESGIKTVDQIKQANSYGIFAFLIGTSITKGIINTASLVKR